MLGTGEYFWWLEGYGVVETITEWNARQRRLEFHLFNKDNQVCHLARVDGKWFEFEYGDWECSD